MLNKIILGTANFTQSYGILSGEKCLNPDEIIYILSKAIHKGICTIDTALGYGDITEVIPARLLKKIKIITKISVLDSKDTLVKKMQAYKGLSIHGLLIHDPSNIKRVDEGDLKDRLDTLKHMYEIEKIGISAYDIKDIEDFSRIRTPEILQIPLNPLNQSFDKPSFIEWVKNNAVEVHGRSLFLQGILLTDTLPEKLNPLWKEWNSVKTVLQSYESPLQGLLIWAASKDWIDNWVVGVSSLRDLEEIIDLSSSEESMVEIPVFPPSSHPLADPRKW